MGRHVLAGVVAVVFLGLFAHRVWQSGSQPLERHSSGEHPGSIVSLAGDRYHAQFVATVDGQLCVYLLDRDPSRVLEVELQQPVAYVTFAGDTAAHPVELHPDPQPGDRAGRTSRFSGSLVRTSTAALADVVQVMIANLRIGDERFHLAHEWRGGGHQPAMPVPLAEAEQLEMYGSPAGKYTRADIEANGGTSPAMKYRGFRARHDTAPALGDRLCPITRTKANPACTWVIGGEVYQFCCPPCVDEFVRLARESPGQIRPPGEYVQR